MEPYEVLGQLYREAEEEFCDRQLASWDLFRDDPKNTHDLKDSFTREQGTMYVDTSR